MNSKTIYRYFDKMRTSLELSNYESGHTRLMALILDKHGTIISKGENSYSKSHPKMRYIANVDKIYLHAEIDACIKGEHLEDKWHTMIIVRVDYKGRPKLAKPCENCSKYIQNKFKNVYYSDNNGNLVLYKDII